MLQKTIMANLANGDVFRKIFPHLKRPEQTGSYPFPESYAPREEPQIPLGGAYPTPTTAAQMPSLLGAPLVQPMPENPAPMQPDPGFDRSTLDVPSLVLNKKEKWTANRDAAVEGITDPTRRDLKLAEYDFENPEDRDKGWGRVKEIISNFLYGAGQAGPDTDWRGALTLGGVGAVGGLLNKSWNEQRDAASKIPYLRQKAQYESKQASEDLARQNVIVDNDRQRLKNEADAEYKRLEHDRKAQYDIDRANLGETKANDLRYWRDRRLELQKQMQEGKLAQGSKELELAEKKIAELARDNDLDRASREKIAGMRESNTNRRQQIAIEAQKIAATVREAEAAGRQKEAIEARKELAKLKAEDDGLKNQ